MKVIKDKVLVKIIKEKSEVKTPNGLFLPQINNKGIEKAVVIESGNESISVGNECFNYEGCGKEFTNPSNNEKYRVISVSEVIVILNK